MGILNVKVTTCFMVIKRMKVEGVQLKRYGQEIGMLYEFGYLGL